MASIVQNNNSIALTSPEQKCTGEFGALAGDKSPSLPGTADFGKSTYSLPKVRTNYGKFNIRFVGSNVWIKKMDLMDDTSDKYLAITKYLSDVSMFLKFLFSYC